MAEPESRKSNSRKSLLPLFVYLILREESDERKHLTQRALLQRLAQEPWRLTVERKSLSRCLHLLTDADLGVIYEPHAGAWMQKQK